MLIFIICGLVSYSLLFIETHFNGFIFNTLQPKNVIATTKTYFINLSIFMWYCSFSLNTCEYIKYLIYHQLQ